MDGGGRVGWFPSNHVMRLPRQKKTKWVGGGDSSNSDLGTGEGGGGRASRGEGINYREASWADETLRWP